MQNKYYDEARIALFPSAIFHQMGVNGKVSGSIFALEEIPNAVAVVHGAVGCGYHYRYSARTRNSPNFRVTSSRLEEYDIIFGGESKLLDTILAVYEQEKPTLIAIVPTPVSDIIQDDLRQVAKDAMERCGIPVILSKSELFSHRDRNYARKRLKKLAEQKMGDTKSLDMDITGCGYSETLCALVEQVMQPQTVEALTVTIESIGWGVRGNQLFAEMEETLALTGVRLVNYFPAATLQDIKTMPRVALNIVKRTHWAKTMREKFGTPFLEIIGTRYSGLLGIGRFYQDIGNVLGISEEMAKVVAEKTQWALAETHSERISIAKYKVYLITSSLSNLPYLLKRYQESYQLQVVGCMVHMTNQAMSNSAIDDVLLATLLDKARESAKMYYPQLEVKINLSDTELCQACQNADVIIGTTNHCYEALGKPLVSTSDEEASLTFESYVRSVKDLAYRLTHAKCHGAMILNKMSFQKEYFPLLDEHSLIAGRKMWSTMWLERGSNK